MKHTTINDNNYPTIESLADSSGSLNAAISKTDEFKKLKAEYKEGVKAKKKTLKKQYKSIKKQLKKSNAEIMASELESDKPKYVQTSLNITYSKDEKNSNK